MASTKMNSVILRMLKKPIVLRTQSLENCTSSVRRKGSDWGIGVVAGGIGGVAKAVHAQVVGGVHNGSPHLLKLV